MGRTAIRAGMTGGSDPAGASSVIGKGIVSSSVIGKGIISEKGRIVGIVVGKRSCCLTCLKANEEHSD
jgi:hypothetical protein